MEYYDIANNEWRTAAAMPWRGVTVKCAAVGDVVYVLAGFQGVGRLGHVLEYHTDTDRLVPEALEEFREHKPLTCTD